MPISTRFKLTPIFVLGVCSSAAFAQVPAQTAGARARLTELATVSSLDLGNLKPWHIQMSFELYDLAGKPQENGTIEEWWVSPGKYRLQISSPSFKQTIPGATDAVKDSSRESYLIHRLLSEVVHPVPSFATFDQLTVSEEKRTIGKIPMSCLVVANSVTKSAPGSSSSAPEFCTDTASGELRAIFDAGEFQGIRNHIGHFQEITVALDHALSYAGKPAIVGHTTQLQNYFPEESSVDLTTVPPPEIQIPGIVMAGKRTQFVQPSFPPEAKTLFKSGTAVLSAVVGEDGKIAGLSIASTTDQVFNAAALAAVKKWQYQPYLINGKPTAVDTTIMVNFSLN